MVRLVKICLPSANDGVEEECVYIPEDWRKILYSYYEAWGIDPSR